MNLLCLNIPGILMSIGQPSIKKKAAQLVQVIMHSIPLTTLMYLVDHVWDVPDS